ncbi:MAG: RDD family protein [Myxococcota bacterium]
MNDINPYQAPVEDQTNQPSFHGDGLEPPLASRGSRLGAAIIDGFALTIPNFAILIALGLLDFDNPEPDFINTIITSLIGLVVFAAVQWYFLQSGQTVGKRALGLRMVDVNSNEPPSAGHLFALRYLPFSLLAVIPAVGPLISLVNVLWIFGSEQRCLHDRMANTKVVMAGWSPTE